MRVLHAIKTSEGASWAALQVAELVRHGIDVHVALPDAQGRMFGKWKETGARIHIVPLDYPAGRPWRLSSVCDAARRLVNEINPDLIHSHFAGTTLVLRRALGKGHPIPRIFQVPGPLHMEHSFFRNWELSKAGPADFWIATSWCIYNQYRRAGIAAEKLFLSYSGVDVCAYRSARSGILRKRLGIGPDQFVVGNINFIYAPKHYLGHRIGLKGHEDVIEALSIVIQKRSNVAGLLAGGAWGKAGGYEQKLRRQAARSGHGRIHMPGYLPLEEIQRAWPDFDCAVHVPLSENCGGVVEPLLAAVPTIAAHVGGLPELVFDGVTGKMVSNRNPLELAEAILEILSDLDRWRALARNGQRLARTMFDSRRTAAETLRIYRAVCDSSQPAPVPFEPALFLRENLSAVPAGGRG